MLGRCKGVSGPTGSQTGSQTQIGGSPQHLNTETVIAKMLLEVLDPALHEGSGVARARDIDGLAVVTEPEIRVTCVRAHIAENPLYRREVPMRRETDRLRPCGQVAKQLAGVARIDGNQG